MHPITTNPQWPKESYSWAEAVPDASWRPGKPGQDFGENGDCLQQRGREAGVSHGDASRSQNLSRTRVEGGGGGSPRTGLSAVLRVVSVCPRLALPGRRRVAAPVSRALRSAVPSVQVRYFLAVFHHADAPSFI